MSILLWPLWLSAATVPSGFADTAVTGYWPEVAGLTFDETGRMYVWERAGRIWIFENDVQLPTPLIDISDEVGAWEDHGLLSVALHPNFRQNGYIYLYYVVDHHHLAYYGTPNYNPSANEYYQATIVRVTRYTARLSDNFRSVDLASRTILIGESASTGVPSTFESHIGGTLLFGTDATLLLSTGDGAQLNDSGSNPLSYYDQALREGIITPNQNVGAFRAQMLNSLSGKILRFDPLTGNGVPGNPFYDPANPRAARSRVWALGLRNPFRMTLRPGTGSHNSADGNPGVLYVGDVGYDTWEELSVVSAPGLNLGWPVFEGLEVGPSYADRDPANQDAPNPLYGSGGCTQQFFTFRNLLKQATLATPSWPNPCSPSQQIPGSTPRFLHTRPVLDWKHGSGPARTGIYNGTDAAVINVGASGSPVSGPQFGGNCAIGGIWYQGSSFPASYKNTYFLADLGGGWIRNLTFDVSNNPVSVRDFATGVGGIVCIAENPVSGSIYYVDFYGGIRKISFGGNLPPTAVASSDFNYGPTPLIIHFTGSRSSDPEGLRLLYSWDFGDGSAINTQADPTHVFNAQAGVPTLYVVTLTVTDPGGLSSQTSLNISLNNTPPSVAITSPARGTKYSMAGAATYNLIANVTDAEQSDSDLFYQWQTILHHNNHEHLNPVDTNHVTTTVLSPIGCDGNLYYYRIVLTVTDSAGLSTQAEVDLYPDCTDTPPTISDIADQNINSNTSTGPLNFIIGDAETAASNLVVTGSSSDLALVPNSNISFGGSGSNRTVTVTPTANRSGSATIAVTVSDGSLATSDTFVLSVNSAANTPPSISDIPDQTTAEDTSTGQISFTIGDAETAPSSLVVSGSSSNPALVPNNKIVFGGGGSTRTVTIVPATNQAGSATITVTVSDGSATASDTFVLTVTPVNDAPTISDIADRLINQDTSTGPIPFSVGDAETAGSSLLVSGSSSNPALVPDSNIVFGGSGANRTVTVTPAANQFGTATIAVRVSDGSLSASDTFVLTVNSASAPTYLLSEDFEGTGFENSGWIKHGTSNPDYTTIALHGAQSLNCIGAQYLERPFVFANSFYLYFQARWNIWGDYNNIIYWDDPGWNIVAGLYANHNRIELNHGSSKAYGTSSIAANTTYHVWVEWTKGTGTNGTMKLFVATTGSKPAAPEASITTGNGGSTQRIYIGPTSSGPDVIFDRILVDDVPIGSIADGGGTASNSPPVISDIPDQTISQGGSAGPINFTIGDPETAAGSLVLSGSSSNPALVPNSNIVFGGSGSNHTVTVTPTAGQSGSATISVSVSDGSLTASDTFVLSVTPVSNTPPSISDIADQSTPEDTSAGPIQFAIGDAETAASSLVVSGSSSNPALVPNSKIVFGGSGSTRTVTTVPATNQSGTATITVTVSDGTATASDTFVLTVTPVNDAPTISNIPDTSINQNTSSGPISFTVGDVDTASSSLALSASSSNPTLVPVENIVFAGSGSNRTVTITPATNQFGTATITVTVSDGSLSASDPMVLTVNSASAPTYLFSEGFEGTGFENAGWIKHGTLNADYTNLVLNGSQSLNCSGGQYVERPFVSTNSFYLYFQVRWNTWTDYNNIIYWDDPGWNIVAGLYANYNRMELNHGSAGVLGTTTLAANTTYHVWVEWTKGTGTDGTMKLFISTTGVKPVSPEASITNGNGGATQRIYIGPTSAGPNVIFDRILVGNAPIGSNP